MKRICEGKKRVVGVGKGGDWIGCMDGWELKWEDEILRDEMN